MRGFAPVGVLVILVASCTGRPRQVASSNRQAAGKPLDSSFAQLETIRQSNPREYEALRAVYFLGVQTTLNQMGFRSGPYTGDLDAATESATRAFESARGLPVTGNPFTRETLKRLNADEQRFQRAVSPDIGSREFESGLWSSGFASAKGPWVSSYDSVPAAINVECHRERKECILAEAEYDTWGLVPSIDIYQVDSWDDVEIRSKPSDAVCQRTVLTLNRTQESVTLTTSTLHRTGLCKPLFPDSAAAMKDRVRHLATTNEIGSLAQRRGILMIDTLLVLAPSLRAAFQDSFQHRRDSVKN